jgi:topoisomerase-4 subunit A
VLPARLPNVLLNGTTGIAVGMATDIPPHNLREVARACIHLLDNPKADVDGTLRPRPGAGLSHRAEIITPKSDLVEMYRSGTAACACAPPTTGKTATSSSPPCPTRCRAAKVLEQIAPDAGQKAAHGGGSEDESDHEEPIRIVIVPRSNRVDVDALMATCSPPPTWKKPTAST